MTTVRGDVELLRTLQRLGGKYQDAVNAAIHQEANDIMAEAVNNCPVKYGRLRASQFIEQPDQRSRIKIGFGTEYAYRVHELTAPGVNWTTPGTGPKFLENAVKRATPGFAGKVAQRARINLERGVGVRSATPRTRAAGS